MSTCDFSIKANMFTTEDCIVHSQTHDDRVKSQQDHHFHERKQQT